MKESRANQIFWYILGILALLLQISFFYLVYYHHHYLVPPGGDIAAHYRLIQDVLANGLVHFSAYPRLFHLIVIELAKITHRDIFYVLTYWTPVLIFLPVFSMLFLLRQIFTVKVTVLSLILMILANTFTYYAFIDGSYPEMLAYGVFAVLLFGFVLRYYRTNKWPNLLYGGIFLILIGLTHHFTLFNTLAILGIFAILQFYLFLVKFKVKLVLKYLLGLGVPLVVLAIGYIVMTSLYNGMLGSFLPKLYESVFNLKSLFYWNAPLAFTEYPRIMGPLVWYLGTIGLFYLLITSFISKEQSRAKQLTIIWFIYLLAMSHFCPFDFQGRFAREMVYPSIIFSGFLLAYLVEQNTGLIKSRLVKIIAYGFLGLLIMTNSALYSTGLDKIADGLTTMIWYWPVDQQKVDYLSANVPLKSTVLYSSEANMFTPLKSKNNLVMIHLSSDQLDIVDKAMTYEDDKKAQKDYKQLIAEQKDLYWDMDYIFVDFRPPGEIAAATKRGNNSIYEEQKKVLQSMAEGGQEIQAFSDGSAIYRMK